MTRLHHAIICGLCLVASLPGTTETSFYSVARTLCVQNLFSLRVPTELCRLIPIAKIFITKFTPHIGIHSWSFGNRMVLPIKIGSLCGGFFVGHRSQLTWSHIPELAISESALALIRRRGKEIQFDGNHGIFRIVLSDILKPRPGPHSPGSLFVIYREIVHPHIRCSIYRSRDLSSQIGNILSPVSLVFGLNGQFVGISGTASYLQPLQSYKYASENSHGQPISSQANCGPFKCGHAFFYFVELLYGYWLACWRGIFWWGYTGWRGIRGNVYVLVGGALAIHGAVTLLHPLLWR
jgi:hypothetical protein